MNNINWKDAFNDEEFRNELDSYIRKYIEDHPKLDSISEEDFNNIFDYDESTETVSIKMKAIDVSYEDDSAEGQLKFEELIKKTTNYVKMHLLLSLMLSNGLKIDKNNMKSGCESKKQENRGNGVVAAKIMCLITGIPLSTCKNFISDPYLGSRLKNNFITQIDSMLIKMGMNISLRKKIIIT